MADDLLTRAEHTEFAKRMEENNKRIDHRLADVESDVKEINNLVISVNKLATNMELMLEEQKEQGTRLEALEKRPIKKYDTAITAGITAVVTAVVTALITMLANGGF